MKTENAITTALLGLAVTSAACGGATDPASDESSTTADVVASGSFVTTPAGAELGYAIEGQILILSDPTQTRVDINVRRGLGERGMIYPAHVHAGACADGGGGHYLIDPAAGAAEENEIWPTVTSFGGRGRGTATAPLDLRPDAKAVVIHDPVTKAKVACADIQLNVAFGELQLLEAGVAAGSAIRGWGILFSGRQRTITAVYAAGLTANTEYPTHVHAAPCAQQGGGHYVLDPTHAAGADNEIWPTLASDAGGRAFSRVVTPAAVSLGAQAIVIHDPVTKAKIACADLD